jgi:hypothetical protein
MEYLHGVKLVDAIRDFYTRVAQSRYLAGLKGRVREPGQISRCRFQQSLKIARLFMSRPRNMTLDELQEEYRRLGKTPPPEWKMAQYQWIEWGKVKSYNSLATLYNWTLGWVAPNLRYSEYGASEMRADGWISCFCERFSSPSVSSAPGRVLNVPRILRHLFDVHGHQILVDGTVWLVSALNSLC